MNASHGRRFASAWGPIAASVLALALAACSGGATATTVPPAPPSASAPAATQSPTAPVASASASAAASASASAAGSAAAGDQIQLAAQSIQFSTKELQAPSGKAFTIEFTNNDSGIAHNVEILDANNTSVFKGDVFPGVATQTYQVPALKAGTYSYLCDVHPTLMTGTLTVG